MDLKSIQKIVGTTADGKMGPKTKAAIIAYQKKLGVTADGNWGPITQAAYDKSITPVNMSKPISSTQNYTPAPTKVVTPTKTPVVAPTTIPSTTTPIKTNTTPTTTNLQQGSSGDSVKQLQATLGVTQDGAFGPQTKSAVMKFQQDNGLVQDGVWGPLSAAALAKGGTTTPTNTESPTTDKGYGTGDTYTSPTGYTYKLVNGTPTGDPISTSPNGTTTLVTPIEEQKQINTDANTEMNSELEKLLNAGTKVDTSDSAKLAETITSVLTTVGEAPKVPSSSELAAEQRKTLGIDTLENQNNDVTAQIAKLDEDYKGLDESNTNRVQGMSQINRRKSADQTIYEKARGELVLEQNRIADQLTTKYGILNTFMQYNQTDYTNAVNSYNGNYSRAIDLINLFKGVQSDQKSETENAEDDAKANLQIIMDAVGTTSWDNIDVTNQALITKLEAQSGLPSGFTQAVIGLNSENSGLTFKSIGSSYTDASGKKVTPVYYSDPTTGVISAQLMTLGSVQKTSTTTKTNDVANFTDFLKTGKDGEGTVFGGARGTDGFTDPQVYISAFNNWPGTTAQFLSAFPVKTNVNPIDYKLLPASIQPTTTSSTRSS